jgi:hypothetical protein
MKHFPYFLLGLLLVWAIACQPITLTEPVSGSKAGARVAVACVSPLTKTLDVRPDENITKKLSDACTDNTILIIPEGRYLVDEFTITASCLTIVGGGTGGATLVSGKTTIVTLGALNNLTFKNIGFQSDNNSTKTDFLGLVTSRNVYINDLTFDNCRFTAPKANTNGLKFIMDNSGFMSNLFVKNCLFQDIGRMGVELTVHRPDHAVGFENVQCISNTFRRLGLVIGDVPNGDNLSDHYGQAISLSGVGNKAQLNDNVIDDPYSIGLEVTYGCTNLEIKNNEFKNLTRTNAEFSYRPLSIMSVDGKFATTNATISNNRTTSNCITGTLFTQYLADSKIESNNFNLTGTDNGGWQIRYCVGNTFSNNTVTTSAAYGLYIIEQSAGNIFSNMNINTSTSTNLYAAVQFDYLGVANNQFCGLITNCDASKAFVESHCAAGNTNNACPPVMTSSISGSYDHGKWRVVGNLVDASNYVIQVRDNNKDYINGAFLSYMTPTNRKPFSIFGNLQLADGDYYLFAYAPQENKEVYSAKISIRSGIGIASTDGCLGSTVSKIDGSYDPTTQTWTTSGILINSSRNVSNYAIQVRDKDKIYISGAFLSGKQSGSQWSFSTKLSMPAGDYYLFAYEPGGNTEVYSTNLIRVSGSSTTSKIDGSYDPTTQTWTTSGNLVDAKNYAIQVRKSDKSYLGPNSFLIGMTGGSQWSSLSAKLSVPAGDYYLFAYEPGGNQEVYSTNLIRVP